MLFSKNNNKIDIPQIKYKKAMEEIMKIILDAMGGDNAPEAPVIGTLDALGAMPEYSYVLVGRENEIRRIYD